MNGNSSNRSVRFRAGFTLLEVLLAIAISTIVIAALFMTIDLQLKIADESRLEVEQAQLAHSILNRIADDLRNSVVYRPQDMSGAFTAIEGSSALSGALGGGTSLEGLGDEGNSSGTGQSGGDESGAGAPNSTSSSSSSAPGSQSGEEFPIPGVYGTNTQIQVDISRLPRVDEYVTLVEQGTTGAASELLSDVKTVAYYVLGQSNTSLLQTGLQPAPEDDGNTGLYFRSVNRAATEFAAYYGGLDVIEQEGMILSERITLLQFEYFDGTQWLLDWDAMDRQGNPVAVRIIMEMYPIDWEMMDETEQRNVQGNFPTYQTVVWLPTAEPTSAGAGSSTPTSSTSDSSSSSPNAGSSTSEGASAGTGQTGGSR